MVSKTPDKLIWLPAASIRMDYLYCVGDVDDKLPVVLRVVVDTDLDDDVVDRIPKEHMISEESSEL